MKKVAIMMMLLMVARGRAATVTLDGALITTGPDFEIGSFTFIHLERNADSRLMEPCPLEWVFPAIPESFRLPSGHPMRHPEAFVSTAAHNIKIPGEIPLYRVIRYLLGTADEAEVARHLLENSGYGPKGQHYLLMADHHVVADGQVFPDLENALIHLVDGKIERALYVTDEDLFPNKELPPAFKFHRIKFELLDWSKR